MKDVYIKEKLIEYTNVDATGYLGAQASLNILQDCSTEFMGSLDSSNNIIKETDNAAWVITKSALHLENLPYWNQAISIKTCAYEVRKGSVGVQFTAENEDGSLAFSGVQELCVIDLSARKLKRVDEIHFPKEVQTYDLAYPHAFNRIRNKVTDSDKVKEMQVSWLDTDFTQHTNNASYLRYVLGAFTTSELQSRKLSDMEIYFQNESVADDTLSIYRIDEGDETIVILKREEVTVVSARLKFF